MLVKIEYWYAKWLVIAIGCAQTAWDLYQGYAVVTWVHWCFIALLICAMESLARWRLKDSELQLDGERLDYDALLDRHVAFKQTAEDELRRLRSAMKDIHSASRTGEK
jgi:hypothetical protein